MGIKAVKFIPRELRCVCPGGFSPTLTFSASLSSNTTPGYGRIHGDVNVLYYYMIVMPGGGSDMIPVSWSSTSSLSATADTGSPPDEATISVGNVDSVGSVLDGTNDSPWWNFEQDCWNAATPWQNCTSLNWPQQHVDYGQVEANTWVWIKMSIGGNLEVQNAASGTFSFSLDPIITINPAWLAQHPGSYVAYSVPTSPTPEPSSLLLLGSGVLGVAGVIRRKLSAG